jgi:ParB family chromosome partitioning protein
MLGKGLESLIPPQKGDFGANEPVRPSEPAQPVQPEPQPQVQPQPQPQAHPQPQAKKEDVIAESVFHIEVEKIKPNPSQPRRDFNPDSIRDLASSIREFGILQPLVVTKIERETPTGLDVEYQLIAGERRFLASKLLGLRVVPAIIRKVNLEREKLELAVIENIQRENLNPVETARAFQRLQEEFHLTQREIAAKLGKSRETVANSVRLLDLPAYIQEALQKGDITESHGRLLLAVEDPAAQKKLFDDISLYRLTTRDVKERVERLRRPYGSGVVADDEANLPPEVRAMKESLAASLGAPVEIKKGVNTGRISITFYSQEELENILRRLGKEQM